MTRAPHPVSLRLLGPPQLLLTAGAQRLERRPAAVDAGELLQGYHYDDAPDIADWLAGARDALRELQLRVLAAEAERLERDGDLATALACVQQALRREPLAEDLHRRLMRLHHLMGDRAAALAAFQRCRQRLAEELGTRPAAPTLELAREIERGGDLPPPRSARPAVPLAMQRPPRLVGREAAWATMEEAWSRGQVIFVSGPAGSGKTRLVEDFASSKGPLLRIEGRPGDAQVPHSTLARNQRKVLAHRGDLRPGTPGPLPPWVWQEAARLMPELLGASPARPAPDKLRFYLGLMTLYAQAIQGLAAMVVDDLQFYDEASLEQSSWAMAQAVPLGAGMPHHVAAFRDDEVAPVVPEMVERMVAHGLAVWIRLQPLSPDAVAEWLHSVLPDGADGLAPALLRYTGGNPLFMLETVRHLHLNGQLAQGWPGRLPPGGKVRELIDRRLARLSAPALQLAQAAAVLQGEGGFEAACALVDQPPAAMAAAWHELASAQVMAGERFSHDLLFETVLAGIPDGLRGWLHRAAAALLEARGGDPARVAVHWQAGGDAARAARCWQQAADIAAARGLPDEAQALRRKALDYHPRPR